jgi:hypothetical protein
VGLHREVDNRPPQLWLRHGGVSDTQTLRCTREHP